MESCGVAPFTLRPCLTKQENTARCRPDMADRASGAQIMLHRNAPANAGEMQEERPWKDRHPVSVAGVHVAAQHDCLC